MANSEQAKRLKAGIEEWNTWRRDAQDPVALTGANLAGADLAGANLAGADLAGASLRSADLTGASLTRANLTFADLTRANLTNADLTGADLTGANLWVASLARASLRSTDLTGAKLLSTVFGESNLSTAIGLETVLHARPSLIATGALDSTASGLSRDPSNRGAVESFFRSAGVSEPLMEAFSLMIASPIEFYSCFISYSHRDKPFARRLYDHLQARGVRCWLDERQLLPGDDIYEAVDHGIRIWDKVLLCCSEDSLTSWWVKDEIDKALEKERQLRKDRDGEPLAIIPLNLDGFLLDGWQDGRSSTIRKRLAADFTGWESDNAKFEQQFERVVQALKTERDPDPKPKL